MRTIFPRRLVGVRGGELTHPVAPAAREGNLPCTGNRAAVGVGCFKGRIRSVVWNYFPRLDDLYDGAFVLGGSRVVGMLDSREPRDNRRTADRITTRISQVNCIYHWQPVSKHLLVLALLGILLVEISLQAFRKIPFACSYLPGTGNLHLVFWVFLGFSFPPLHKATELEREMSTGSRAVDRCSLLRNETPDQPQR